MIDNIVWAAIPITAILTSHFQRQAKIKRDMLKEQLEVERLKQENFIAETEKLRLELKKMELDHTANHEKLL